MIIALLTCKKLPNLTESDKLLIPAFAKKNILAIPVIWNDETINWLEFDFLIFRNTWDYYENQIEFDEWLRKIEKLEVKTLNSISVINKNKHKFYLKDLENLGIKIIPTIFINKTENLSLIEIIPVHWEKVIIKPACSAGSFQTELFEISEIEKISQKYALIASEKELLLQEFMTEIKTLGETSFIFFNKKFSHAVNKKPTNNDFRIQEQFGGIYKLIIANELIIKKASLIVDTFNEDLLYARVDGIVIDNELHLMEVECLEPDLYFNLLEGSIDQFVASVLKLIAKF